MLMYNNLESFRLNFKFYVNAYFIMVGVIVVAVASFSGSSSGGNNSNGSSSTISDSQFAAIFNALDDP